MKRNYSARFNASLVLLTLITTLAMCVIGNNIALSLGMVGALSIVRFRTAIKDPRDTAYIFWAVCVGICCGISDYEIAGMGTLFLLVITLAIGNAQSNDKCLLVIRTKGRHRAEIEACVQNYYGKKAIFKADNTSREKQELIYQVSSAVAEKAAKKEESINDLILGIEGVEAVNFVSQNNEFNQ